MPNETKSSPRDPLTTTTGEEKVELSEEELGRIVGGLGIAGGTEPESQSKPHLNFTFKTVFTTKVS